MQTLRWKLKSSTKSSLTALTSRPRRFRRIKVIACVREWGLNADPRSIYPARFSCPIFFLDHPPGDFPIRVFGEFIHEIDGLRFFISGQELFTVVDDFFFRSLVPLF